MPARDRHGRWTGGAGSTLTDRERFMGYVERSDSGCWLWAGALNGDGYGTFTMGGKTVLAHRAAYALFNGPIPPDREVMHSCEPVGRCGDITHRRCANPDHLATGTHAENMGDMARRDRQNRPIGERNPRAKVRECDIPEIRRRWRAGARQVDLAFEYGIRQSTISAIVRGQTWAAQAIADKIKAAGGVK